MLTKELTIKFNTNDDIAIANLVNIANNFVSTISVENDKVIANCKSIMGMLAINLKNESKVTLSIDGNDEIDAMKKLSNFIGGLND